MDERLTVVVVDVDATRGNRGKNRMKRKKKMKRDPQ